MFMKIKINGYTSMFFSPFLSSKTIFCLLPMTMKPFQKRVDPKKKDLASRGVNFFLLELLPNKKGHKMKIIRGLDKREYLIIEG